MLGAGAIGFRAIHHEGWVESRYRAVVTTTLTGLASRLEGAAAQLFSIVVLLAGVAIFLYLAGAIVAIIAQGVVGDIYGERRRRRAIDNLANHTRERQIRAERGAHASAVRKRDHVFQMSPASDDVLGIGDPLIGVGTTEQIWRPERLFAPTEAVV